MNLRKYFELWTFNVETDIDYRDFGTKYILHNAIFSYIPYRLIYVSKPVEYREWIMVI